MKRETNTNGFKRRQRNALNGMQAISNEQVSSACITAFFPIKVFDSILYNKYIIKL